MIEIYDPTEKDNLKKRIAELEAQVADFEAAAIDDDLKFMEDTILGHEPQQLEFNEALTRDTYCRCCGDHLFAARKARGNEPARIAYTGVKAMRFQKEQEELNARN